jgi:diguanylate cyclase (GGDEF)-like protein
VTAPTIDALAAELAQARREITDLRAEVDRYRHRASHDPLTGLLNRDGLAEKWMCEVDHLDAVALVDLDYFKEINDQYGHAAGDHVLVHVARDLVSRYRLVCRLGGDELVIVDHTRRLADLETEPLSWLVPTGATVLTVTGTVGLTQAVATRKLTLARADAAMYRAKAAGRGSVAWWSGALDSHARRVEQIRPRPRVRLRDTRAGDR